MGPEKANGGLNGETLSSWKEIAAYLKCGVRTCIRWEQERALPVHRMAEAPGSRVYAYKSEIDAWLAKELSSKGGRRALNVALRRWGRLALLIVPTVALAVTLLLVFSPRPIPEPFDMGRFGIVTSEVGGPGRLRVWEPTRKGDYRSTWSVVSGPKNTVRHTTIAAGDIDGDGKTELAAPTQAKQRISRGETEIINYVIFVNFYKDGEPGLWKTTFYSQDDYVLEENDYRLNEVTLRNLDDDPENEIILKTASHLSILDYRPDIKEIKKIASVLISPEGRPAVLRSVSAGRLDRSGPTSIIISADEVPQAAKGPQPPSGWLIFADLEKGQMRSSRSLPVDAGFCDRALRAGDVNRDGLPEIFATARRLVNGQIEVFLLGWDVRGNKIADILLPRSPGDGPRSAALAVHDITFEAGADVLVGLQPNQVLLYEWGRAGLELRSQYMLDTPGAMITAVGSADTDGDNVEEVVVAGGADPGPPGAGRFLLEILGYRSTATEFYKEWLRAGGAADEVPVDALAIALK